ncbi:hypothetical protein HLB44_08580 [Aquincola sp. S2]|uniref:DUF6265 domain-containing protein n=1 Tax=Pseudaquabacterium terrae TaxID=2732868 RepID=A0ABX2EEJ0_9BURK|nr:DUF6265 family protein [Aquabacterium terrae]NRF67034.1 hypothetical protein [Aquabacterium terrae]
MNGLRLGIALAFTLVAGLAVPARAQGIEQLAWLAGCWSAEGGEPGSGEQWMAPAGGTMFGIGRTIQRGRTVEYEFVQIKSGADGQLVYVATPSGQRETTFTLKSQSTHEVVFENSAHDFPQRVIYRLLPDGRLAARIEGLRQGVLRGIDFPMRRAACEALAR